MKVFWGDLMDERIYQFAKQVIQINQNAYEVYCPLVKDVCSRTVSEDICIHILVVLRFILKLIGECGKTKIVI